MYVPLGQIESVKSVSSLQVKVLLSVGWLYAVEQEITPAGQSIERQVGYSSVGGREGVRVIPYCANGYPC